MRSLGGLILLAGVGVGLFVYLPAPVDRDTSLENARRLAATTTTAQKQPAPPSVVAPASRSFSPRISLTSFERGRTPSVIRPAPNGGWHTAAADLAGDAQYKTLEPTNPESRYQLVVDLQTQLKRVGCYYGRIDGSWGPGSKGAMQSFKERVNATLPSDRPDYVLLSLLKAQNGKVCGACPSDQLVSPDGRCVANATLAYGRGGGDVTGATTSKEVLPWQSAASTPAVQPAAKSLFTPLPTSVVSSEPLPGRMSIGGPSTLPPVNSVYAPQPVLAGNGQTSVATAAPLGAPVGEPPAVRKPPKTSSYKRHRRYNGPGTPHYNLMLSLGGVY